MFGAAPRKESLPLFNMLSDLKALRDIISSSVDSIVDAYEAAGVDFPSLNEPFPCTSGDERKQPNVAEAESKVIASAAQLIATVQDPHQSLLNFMLSVRSPAF